MKKLAYGVLFLLALGNMASWPYVLKASSLEVTFFDVGQGDAIFIQTPQGHQVLIDGGPSAKITEKVGKVLPFWDTSLDLVILTHPDANHITGLVDVLRQYEVQNVLWTGLEKDTNIFASWKAAILAEEANVWLVDDPQFILWSHREHEYLAVLYGADQAKQVNDTSVVTKLQYGNRSFLLPGDVSKVVEQEMINKEIFLDADVLKVPHHGSKSSSSENFLAAVTPEIAVVQVGANNHYGHPTFEALDRLSKAGAAILRTDENSDIIIQTNGNTLTIQ